MVGVEDEDLVHRRFDHRIDFIILGRNAERHAQEVGSVAELVLRIDEGLTDRIFESHRRDRRDLGDQPVRSDQPLLGIGNVCRIVIESRKRADHAAHDRHRMRVTPEAAIEGRELLVQHGVAADRVAELVELCLARQLAIEQQIGDLHEARLLGELIDRIAAMEEHAFIAVGHAAGVVHEAVVVIAAAVGNGRV